MGTKPKPRKVEIDTEYGIDVRFQIIRPKDGSSLRKHLVFDSRPDFEYYFMAKDGVVPELGLNWRVAELGVWVLADDGGVCQIIHRGSLKHPKDKWRKAPYSPNGYCRTVVGTFNSTKAYKMDTDFSKHINRYTFTNNPIAATYMRSIKNRDYLTKKERLFVANLMMYLHQGNGRQESMIMAVKDAGYSARDLHSTLKKANLLLQQDRIMKILSEQMKDAAEEIGITIKAIMQETWNMAQGPERAHREDVRLSAIKQSGSYLGMDRPEVEQGMLSDGSGYSGFGEGAVTDGKSNGETDIDELEAEFTVIENKETK